MSAMFSLEGRIALINGAGGGLGLTIAGGLGEAGATTIVNGRNQEKLNSAVALLQHKKITAYSKNFDVTNELQLEREVIEIESAIGPIDILVNNAGIQRRGVFKLSTLWNSALF